MCSGTYKITEAVGNMFKVYHRYSWSPLLVSKIRSTQKGQNWSEYYVPESPDTTMKWIDAIATSIIEFIQALQDDLKERSNPNGADTSIPQIWAKLEVLRVLVLTGKAPKKLEGALAALMYTLLPYCGSMGYQHSYVALCGKLLSVCWALGLDKTITGFMCPGQKTINAFLAILKGSDSDARKLSLKCLGNLYKMSHDTCTNSDIIDLSLTIEKSKPSLESTRSLLIFVALVHLMLQFPEIIGYQDPYHIYHLFGRLTMKFSLIWSDAIEAL
ncbi:hypothetical protein L211DRAFT_845110 [Terfezia boudieri ATCC MYA-4762]|uniref:Uncharacterized protein n=1 Tax=Terfezia boudieri ATCC MYA-4762 TaxID=1051890 RepID=A0A3N4M234_9PEZI|nr:hypothetical protein L211DRAFT_845110 [Terfezia boudieri ATCC MYA-4762]